MTMLGRLVAVALVLCVGASAAALGAAQNESRAPAHGILTDGSWGRTWAGVERMAHGKAAPLGPTTLYLEDGIAERQLEPAEVYERIINGEFVDSLNSAPYVALLVQSNRGSLPTMCSGVVVAKDVILLASHCVVTTNSGSPDAVVPKEWLGVCAGINDRSSPNLADSCFPVRSIAVPREYTSFIEGYDIAAVRIQGNLKSAGAKIATVSLRRKFRQTVGTDGFVRGWGALRRGGGKVTDRLQEVDVRIYGAGKWIERFVCPGNCGVDLASYDVAWGNFDGSRGGGCSGDSGGPTVVQKHGRTTPFRKQVVVGVGSWAFRDEVGRCILTPGQFFSRFSYPGHRKFIKRTLRRWGRTLRLKS